MFTQVLCCSPVMFDSLFVCSTIELQRPPILWDTHWFFSLTSGLPSCQPCKTQCPANSHISQLCTLHTDTQCACDQGFYRDNLRGGCDVCTGCPVGHGVLMECTAMRNTRCSRCPSGTFSDRGGFGRCMSCGVCGEGTIPMQQCNSYQDTVCIGSYDETHL